MREILCKSINGKMMTNAGQRIEGASPRILLHPISRSVLKNLRPTLSYRHIKNDYFLVRSYIAHPIPFYNRRVAAGTPINVGDSIAQELDLNEYLAPNFKTIFCVRVEGNSMVGAGIHDNDILVVDRSLESRNGKIVIACINSELTVKRLKLEAEEVMLMPENPMYSPTVITEETDLKIWGVVVHVIHSL